MSDKGNQYEANMVLEVNNFLDALDIIDAELERIKKVPNLRHLLGEDENRDN
jgi:hypothetical protein